MQFCPSFVIIYPQAKTIIESITDDLDGSVNASTIPFGWDRETYEMDLSKKNAAAFTKLIGPYVDAARKVGAHTRTVGRKSRTTSSLDLGAIRAWAADNGHQVSDRGRVPAAVVEVYQRPREPELSASLTSLPVRLRQSMGRFAW